MIATAKYLVDEIRRLHTEYLFEYPNPSTKTKIRIERIVQPEGPIVVKRFQEGKDPKEATITVQMLWRYANALLENRPINVDRVFGASYNTRSTLEALLAHTGAFYVCYPGRIETTTGGAVSIQKGHKHLLWLPETPHQYGVIESRDLEGVAIVESFLSPILHDIPRLSQEEEGSDNIRRHLQVQAMLVDIGDRLGLSSWIAANDRSAIIGERGCLGELPGVLDNLALGTVLSGFPEAVEAAKLVDCIWARNGRYLPAVIEVEQSTGVFSGLDRMDHLRSSIPSLATNYVIAAPDEERTTVLRKCSRDQYRPLKPKFFPYSAIEELHDLTTRRKMPRGRCADELVEAFMEEIIC